MMKKHGNRGKYLYGTLLAGILLFIQNICAPVLYGQEAAYFRELNGTVEVKAPGAASWTAAAAGDRIEQAAQISTGFKSRAVIVLGNSVIVVQPVTRLSLEELIRNQGGEQVSLYLQTGRVRAEVKPPAGETVNFTVRSPVATASVRGTVFEFDGETIRGLEGRTQYSLPNGRETYVTEGESSYVDESSNRVVTPFEAAQERLAPALPPGSDTGAPLGDQAPLIFSAPAIGLEFAWD
jgi:ferric-dicitrate binding protein FerR (iron transport regulator)